MMEKGHTIAVLDHGYVKYIESWGGGLDGQLEAGIVEAARQSTQGGFKGWGGAEQCRYCGANADAAIVKCAASDTGEHTFGPYGPPGDEKLLGYLATHKHTTPFEFAGATFEVQAPIFVFREWHRHRTQSYSEASARYRPLPDVNYNADVINLIERAIKGQSTTNRQASSTGAIELSQAALAEWHAEGFRIDEILQDYYQRGLAIGVPKELARIKLPVGRYSMMRVTTDLWNWLHFLTLRTAPDAQWEIRQFANAVETILAALFPHSVQLWHDMVHGPDAH